MGESISVVLVSLADLITAQQITMQDNLNKIETAILNGNTGHLPEWLRNAGVEVTTRRVAAMAVDSDDKESDVEYQTRVWNEILDQLSGQPDVLSANPWLVVARPGALEPEAVAEFIELLKAKL